MNYPPILTILIISILPTILSQQPYIRQAITLCDSRDNSTSELGYTCNGLNRTCQSYLTFRAQPPYTSVPTISSLFSIPPSQLSQLNSVQENAVFPLNSLILVPITCSCSGQSYQSNTSYTIQQDDTYLIIANNTFQGLSTCQALQVQNGNGELFPGTRINIPLRCACPTRNQINNGTNYLLSYLVTWNEFVSSISALFNVNTENTLAANGLSEEDFNIYPFTTLLVPLRDPPRISQASAPPPPPPPPPPVTTGGGRSNRTWIYVLIGVLGGIFIIVFFIGVFCYRKKKLRKHEPVPVSSQNFKSVKKPDEDENDESSRDFLESISSIDLSLKVYTFDELKSATNNFDTSSLIKGSVYRGTINGDLAAIKKMNSGDVSNEINLLNKINHFNLIRLSGVCLDRGNWYLIYEYATNGTLADWIHDRKPLDWNTRLQIALDVASGLNYLHRYTSPAHVHKDLNSSNVLLDRDFRAKIANFGLARSAEGQDGHFALTRHIVGTKGYMAPEYLENGLVSTKLDVYAFGVLMVEIFTGREVVSMELSEVLSPDSVGNVMDPLLGGNYPVELAKVVFGLIGSCLKKDLSDRPSMDDVFQSLSRISTSSESGEWAIGISENRTTPR